MKFIADTAIVPGEKELESLALGALRVLTGEEKEKIYGYDSNELKEVLGSDVSQL